jgi:Na+-transporting methylmalonyl-CoA/oxaloacetate decarboxylase gamma subunit
MRIVFGVLSLLIVVAIVGVLAKKQLGSMSGANTPAAATEAGVVVPTGAPKQQVQQVKQAVENAMQQARPVDDTK